MTTTRNNNKDNKDNKQQQQGQQQGQQQQQQGQQQGITTAALAHPSWPTVQPQLADQPGQTLQRFG